MIRLFLSLSLAIFTGSGCGGRRVPTREPVALDQVPPIVLEQAKKNLPGVKFERAMKKENGEYEVIGKEPSGKVREIDIKPDGTVTEIE